MDEKTEKELVAEAEMRGIDLGGCSVIELEGDDWHMLRANGRFFLVMEGRRKLVEA